MYFDCPVRHLERSDFRLLALAEYRRGCLLPSRLPLKARITLATVAAAVHAARQGRADHLEAVCQDPGRSKWHEQ